MTEVLFILKRRQDYNSIVHANRTMSTGLYNSANFMNDMLNDMGISSEIEVAIDNNCIDRLVTKHRPRWCIIEALWVVPTKFEILSRLHPTVTWIIRLHSDMPFMAGEGMSMDWLVDYARFPNIIIAANAPRMLQEVKDYVRISLNLTYAQIYKKVIYLPNYYPQEYSLKRFNRNKDHIDIACFGAIRPLKNHLLQAHSALKFADNIGKKLRFHVNGNRVEMQGGPVINNLKSMFEHLYESGHEMIMHDWMPRDKFKELCATMDIGMQVSFSETFNIVLADLITVGVPIVASEEVPWASKLFIADPTESTEIISALNYAYQFPWLNVWMQQRNLDSYTRKTKSIWYNYFWYNYHMEL